MAKIIDEIHRIENFFTFESFGNFNHFLCAFFLFYLIYAMLSLNSTNKRISLQPLGIFYGTLFCMIFTVFVTFLNYTYHSLFGQVSLNVLFNDKFLYEYLLCILMGIVALYAISNLEFDLSQKFRLKFYSEIALKAYVFLGIFIFSKYQKDASQSILKMCKLTILGLAVYYFLKYLLTIVSSKIRVFKDKPERDIFNRNINTIF